jgi:tRNA pseudouridine13 synthase
MAKVLKEKIVDIAPFDSLGYVKSAPTISAKLKVKFADFRVTENLGFDPSMSGDHLFIKVRKINLSTLGVARKLSEVTGFKLSSIGYSGMKDKRGDCVQWFSIPTGEGLEKAISSIESKELNVITSHLNTRKLKIGSHKENHFRIKLRNCEGSKLEFKNRIDRIMEHGVPNYFGEQRFGKEMRNVHEMLRLLKKPSLAIDSNFSEYLRIKTPVKRSILISAVRAYLFNQLLSTRLFLKNWSHYLLGDILNLDGTDSYFSVPDQAWDEALEKRLNSFDIHISGLLPGNISSKDRYITSCKAADIENDLMKNYEPLLEGLRRMKVSSSRRPLRFRPKNFQFSWEGGDLLSLDFSLRRGCYATSLLREICQIK